MHKIDLDAADAARHEATAAAIELDWRGHTYRLPVEQPLEVGRHFRKLAEFSDDPGEGVDGVGNDGKPILTVEQLDECYNDGMSVLFCSCPELPWPDDDHPGRREHHERSCEWVRFLRTAPSRDTMFALVQKLNTAYGVTSGEAEAPRSSSKSGGAPSRRTGSATTSKTSATSGAGATRKRAAAKATAKAPGDRKQPARKAAASRQS